jgi:hypothetical protein
MMSGRGPLDIRVGDQVRLRKPHPCGGRVWDVVRIGADIGIRCTTCGRRVLLPRAKLEKQVKSIIRDSEEGQAQPAVGPRSNL